MNTGSFVDHLIYRELQYGQRLRRDALRLSRTQLAQKFETTKGVIDGVLAGNPHEDAGLILACHEEAQQLHDELEDYTQAAIAERYGRDPGHVRCIARRIQKAGEVAA